jgi:hypothetical protein
VERLLGTSKSLPGPRGGPWRSANYSLSRWLKGMDSSSSTSSCDGELANREHSPDWGDADDMKAQDIAARFLAALTDALKTDRDAFGLRDSLLGAGSKLVATTESLRTGTAGWFPETTGDAEDRQALFLEAFSRQVAGTGGLVADAVMRRAVTDAVADSLLVMRSPLIDLLEGGKMIDGVPLSDDLFCLLFELFFKQAIAHFITAMISGKVQVLLPALHIIDPAGRIGDWVGEQVTGRIPDPCERHATLGDKPTLADLASGLITETVDRVLGLQTTDDGVAAA